MWFPWNNSTLGERWRHFVHAEMSQPSYKQNLEINDGLCDPGAWSHRCWFLSCFSPCSKLLLFASITWYNFKDIYNNFYPRASKSSYQLDYYCRILLSNWQLLAWLISLSEFAIDAIRRSAKLLGLVKIK